MVRRLYRWDYTESSAASGSMRKYLLEIRILFLPTKEEVLGSSHKRSYKSTFVFNTELDVFTCDYSDA